MSGSVVATTRSDGKALPPAQAPILQEPSKLAYELHGGAYFWYYLPLEGAGKPDLSLYFANLVVDAKYDSFGFHFEPRFRDTKLRPFFGSNIWVQEAYAYGRLSPLVVKAGKVYSRFGKFWDNSFYGNLPYFDGLKLSPDLGVSAELEAFTRGKFTLNAYAQYFVNDGVVNGSLQGRDTVSVPLGRKRNEFVFRAEPGYFFDKDASVSLGASAMFFQADLPEPYGEHRVARYGFDVTINPVRGLSAYFDYARQNGRHVTDYPIAGTPAIAATATEAAIPAVPGQSSRHNDYISTGAEFAIGRVTGRFNFSFVDYKDLGVKETMYQPGVVFALHDNVSLITEYANWSRHAAGSTKLDHSLNFVLYAHF